MRLPPKGCRCRYQDRVVIAHIFGAQFNVGVVILAVGDNGQFPEHARPYLPNLDARVARLRYERFSIPDGRYAAERENQGIGRS